MLLNAMRLQGAQQAGQLALMRVGLVRSYDAANYCVKVEIQPEGTITGWLPLASPWAGNGWGMFCPPSIGDMIEIEFHDGDFDAGVACLRFFNDTNRPLNVPSGELWLFHTSGAFVKLTNDGKVSISALTEIDIGNASTAFRNLVTDAFVTLFNTHTHPVSGGVAQATSQIMGATHTTSVLKAN